MLASLFHAWERRLASATTDRMVRPFDWGADWVPRNGHPPGFDTTAHVEAWVSSVMADTPAFYTPPPTADYRLTCAGDGEVLTFPSAYTTPHAGNNTVRCRFFRAATHRVGARGRQRGADDDHVGARERQPSAGGHRAAVLVLPQWNADAEGHVGLCKLLAWNGMSALRLTLPYHEERMPPELHRADYIVSANIARTLQVCRQAVLDARRAVAWLAREGYDRIGILGTSLGSCLALLTTAHEPLIRAQALNHISPYFADVVWRGLSTQHVRAGLESAIDLERLRRIWRPISPRYYLDRLRDRRTLLVYALYDLTFPVDLSRDLVQAFRDEGVPHEVAVLPCGHYSSGRAPFKFVDGWILTRFLKRALLQGADLPSSADGVGGSSKPPLA